MSSKVSMFYIQGATKHSEKSQLLFYLLNVWWLPSCCTEPFHCPKKPLLETAPGEIHQMIASFSNFNAGITINFSCIAQTTMPRQSTGSTTATVLSLGIFSVLYDFVPGYSFFFPVAAQSKRRRLFPRRVREMCYPRVCACVCVCACACDVYVSAKTKARDCRRPAVLHLGSPGHRLCTLLVASS